jgi:predicted amidohydrolase
MIDFKICRTFPILCATALCCISSAKGQTPVEPESVLKSRRKLVLKMNIYRDAPKKGKGLRIALYQGQQPVGNAAAVKENLDKLEEMAREAKLHHAKLICFPELYLTGYSLDPELVKKLAEKVDGPSLTKVREIAKTYSISVIIPYPELDESSGKKLYYDSIALIGENGELLENYRKTHLFGKAEQLNFSFGTSSYPVREVNGFPIGILNCYEAEFPELSRILALKGAKLVLIPTAADEYYIKPDGQRTNVPYPDVSKLLIPADAYQNNIFVAYSNRCGIEKIGNKQWTFQGNSIICGPHGDVILAADRQQDTLLIADIVPGAYGPTHPEGANYLKDRRPELYNTLTDRKAGFGGGYVYPDRNNPEPEKGKSDGAAKK